VGLSWTKHILSFPAKAIGFQHLLRLSGKKLVLPFYHAVSDNPLSHITPLYTHKSSAEFENDIDFLLKYFTPIGIEQVLAITKDEIKPEKPCFHLTFDDGLREVHSIIMPILKKKGVPATVFVNPSFVGNKALFFRYKAALLIQELMNSRIDELPDFPFDEKVKTMLDWKKWILSVKHHQNHQLDEFAVLLGVDFQAFLEKEKPYLDLPELKELSLNGMTVGSHSLNHPEYRLIPIEEQIRQTTESMAWVKENLQPKIAAFSFPFTDFGVGNRFFEKLKSNPNCPDLFFGTAGLNEEKMPNHLQRIPMEVWKKSAENVLQTNFFTHFLKKGIGKDLLRRKD